MAITGISAGSTTAGVLTAAGEAVGGGGAAAGVAVGRGGAVAGVAAGGGEAAAVSAGRAADPEKRRFLTGALAGTSMVPPALRISKILVVNLSHITND